MAGTHDRDVLLGGGIRAGQTTPLITRDGKLVGMISTHWGRPHKPSERELRMLDIIARPTADLIERRRAAETQRLLLNELNHRVKNTLAVVQAMASRTLARSPDPKEFAKSFGGRVQSLAKIHDLLSAMCGRLRFGKSFVDFFAHYWSELPCVRPLDAAQIEAAGHNALRGLGPGQKPALEAPGA